jgi:hypothetical protein
MGAENRLAPDHEMAHVVRLTSKPLNLFAGSPEGDLLGPTKDNFGSSR